MKRRKLVWLVIMLGCLTSMFKIIRYTRIIENEDPRFYATKSNLSYFRSCFALSFNWFTSGVNHDSRPLLHFPFPLINLPFSLVTDIIMYPLDYYLFEKHMMTSSGEDFWQYIVFKGGKLKLDGALLHVESLNECPNYEFVIGNISPKTVDVIIEASKNKNIFSHLPKLALISQLREDQYWQIYNLAVHLPSKDVARLRNNLLHNPSTPKDLILDMEKNNFIRIKVDKKHEDSSQ